MPTTTFLHDEQLTVAWSKPREWRQHSLASERHWVEEEVTVVLGESLVDQMSWSDSLEDADRELLGAALVLKWQLSS